MAGRFLSKLFPQCPARPPEVDQALGELASLAQASPARRGLLELLSMVLPCLLLSAGNRPRPSWQRASPCSAASAGRWMCRQFTSAGGRLAVPYASRGTKPRSDS
jgi:hypothetical protein